MSLNFTASDCSCSLCRAYLTKYKEKYDYVVVFTYNISGFRAAVSICDDSKCLWDFRDLLLNL